MKTLLKALFSFEGEMGRLAYAAASTGVLVLQLLFGLAALDFAGEASPPDWFWVLPFEAVAKTQGMPTYMMGVGMVVLLLTDWMLLAFACRRTRRVGFSGFVPAAVVVGVQVIAIVAFALLPDDKSEPENSPLTPAGASQPEAQGMLFGMALCVAAILLEVVVLRLYGFGTFMASPFLIGAAAGYLCNRKGDIGPRRTIQVVLGAILLGGLAVLSFALEGIICLILASPMIAAMAIIGGLVGRELTRKPRDRKSRLMSVAFAPILLTGEVLVPPHTDFESVQSVEVAASPEAVWDSVVHMGPIPDAPVAPFRWGLAYPMRGEIRGEGVGAVREGVFSTGVAYERVTEWEPGRTLSFIVLSDPPAMHELSPYREVYAPHTVGYFKTRDARFTIRPLPNGKTRLTLATHHDVDLAPALYWQPFVEWAVHANKTRVLNHFRQQAEAQART